MNKVYALGYGNWKVLQDFINLLKEIRVEVLVDVRRFPTSKNAQFMKENLEVELPKQAIQYECMRETLGGFRRGGYQKYTETEDYRSGIKRLLDIAKNNNVAIMCVEQSYKYCHSRFIMKTLSNMGINVIPID